MKTQIGTSAAALLLASLAACSGNATSNGSGSDGGLSCRSLQGLVDTPTASNTCVGSCTVADPASAADGNFGSKAVLTQQAGAGGDIAVQAKARNGGLFAAGTQVGVIFEASSATQTIVSYQLNTYRAGTMQDSFSLGSDGVGSPTRSISHSVNATTKPYDTVEFKFMRASGSTVATAQVYELCSD